MARPPECLQPPGAQPEQDLWDGHGFRLDCCSWNRSEQGDVILRVLEYNRRLSEQGRRAFGMLKPFAGSASPQTSSLSSGERFVVGAYPKGSIFRFHASTIGENGVPCSNIYLGLLDQVEGADGSYIDSILYFRESALQEFLQYATGVGKATWSQEFTIGITQHDRFLGSSNQKLEFIYRMDRVEVLMKGAEVRRRKPAIPGLKRLVPGPSMG